MSFLGMDPEVLRGVAGRLQAQASVLESLEAQIQGSVDSAMHEWEGDDCYAFSDWWYSHHKAALGASSRTIGELATRLLNNIAEQEQGSGVGSQGHRGGAPGGDRSAANVVDVSDLAEALPGLIDADDQAAVSAWWAGLTPAEQRALVAEHPELIGNTDGLPAWARDAANREMIAVYRGDLEAEAKRLQQNLDDNWFGGTFTDDDRRLEIVNGKLAALDAIESTLALGDRQLLVLDPGDGEQLKAAVAVGNVDTADHVAVFTPGFTSTVQGSLAGYDREMAHLYDRAANESVRYGDGGSVATVTWMGYEAPQWSNAWKTSESVANDNMAQAGAVDLGDFYRGLDSSRGSQVHITALGHSYGSLVTGLTLQQQTGVDSAVIFGSPGLGASRFEDLNTDSGAVYRIEARNDPVADLGAFGIDPSHMAGVGGLSAQDAVWGGEVFRESTGHSEYLGDGTTSQHNMAAVIVGAPDRMITDHGLGAGDVLSWPVPGTY